MSQSVIRGDLLIAPPTMPDPRFSHSLLLVTAHSAQGSHALCVNRPTEHTLKDILDPLDIQLDQNPQLYWGGPVSTQTVWMLHDPDWQIENTLNINGDWSVTSHYKMFDKMAQGDYPERYRIMFGHASWDKGQLAAELEGREPWSHRSSWLVLHRPNPDWLLNSDVESLWTSSCSLCSQQTVDSWMG